MATYTDNYTMTKPTYAEQADISVINANMDIIDNVMHSSQISLAPAYDINETYNTGDIVMHELLMYKCLEDNVTGVWDSTKWTRTTAGEESSGGADLDIYGEASGTAEASFSDGAEASLVECEIGIVPTQDLHGYSKPWAGGAGKNKLDLASDYTLTCNGGQTTTHTIKDGVSVKGGVEYTISCKQTTALSSATRFTLVITNINSTSIYEADATNPTLTPHTHSITFTPDSDQSVNFKFWSAMPSDDIVLSDFMLEVGSQATTYEPYSNICPISGHTDVTVTVASTSGGSGDDTTVSLGRTVYGGKLDILTGELIVDSVMFEPASVSYYGLYGADNAPLFYYDVSTPIKPYLDTTSPEEDELSSNMYLACQQSTYFDMKNGECRTNAAVGASNRIYFRDDRFTDATTYNAQLAQNPLQLLAKLYIPQTFNLTKAQVKTLLGQNYVSHDGGGTISLVYVKGDAPIKPNPADAEIPLTGLEISGKDFVITDARIPAPPTNNGAYVLTVTVSGGTPTYSWENA